MAGWKLIFIKCDWENGWENKWINNPCEVVPALGLKIIRGVNQINRESDRR